MAHKNKALRLPGIYGQVLTLWPPCVKSSGTSQKAPTWPVGLCNEAGWCGNAKKWICSCATQVRWTLQKLLACLELSVGRQGHTHWREKHTFKLCPDWTATHRKINVRAEARYIPKWTEEENKCQLQGHLCLTSFSCLTLLSPCAKLLTVSTPKMLFLPNRTPFRVIFQMKANSSENSPEKAVSCCWTPSRLCKKQTTLPGLAISLCISICRCV